ncbi:MAG: hypothetical protein V9H26_16200 [Verrucomicrobiota bacterium]
MRGIADHAFFFGQLIVEEKGIGPVKGCHFGHGNFLKQDGRLGCLAELGNNLSIKPFVIPAKAGIQLPRLRLTAADV